MTLLFLFGTVLVCLTNGRVLPPETSIFATNNLPTDKRLSATISNGYVGMACSSDTMYIGGVFNGPIPLNETKNSGISHRARIPSTNSLEYKFSSNPSSTLYTLDVNNAIYYENYSSNLYNINISVYAHRHFRNLLVTQIEIDNTKNTNNITIIYSNNGGGPSSDINITTINCPSSIKTIFPNITCSSGWTQISEYNSSLINIVLVHFTLNGNITIPAGNNQLIYYFPTVLLTSLESSSTTILNDAITLFQDLYSQRAEWLQLHVNEWETLWLNGRIDIIGNNTVAASVYSSLYYIISSIRTDWSYGLSPGSLSSDAYSGHTFWDQETWMYPPLLMLQQDLGAGCLEYRNNRIFGSEFTANTSSRNGLQGSNRYPWESAFSGIELQGTQWGTYEIHINADIPLAIREYFYMTKNLTFLNEYYSMLYGICLFWEDWSYLNPLTNLYEFTNVMGPDEYYYPVNNSVYTNFGAQQTISFCIESSKLLNKEYPSKWDDIISSVYIPFNTKYLYHPESDNYERSKTVKQADTIMLYFPWQFNSNSISNDTSQIQINDLTYYATVTDPNGPAMTWAMFVINWLELNESFKAQTYFDKSYLNIRKPFNIWTETSSGGGAVNFITGAGGFLQQFIFGYPGIRINNNYLLINFIYLPWNQMGLLGIDYLQNVLDLMLFQNGLSIDITVRQRNNDSCKLQLVDSSDHSQSLIVNQTVKVSSSMMPIKIGLINI